METNQHRFLNVSDAATYLGVSAASLRKWSDQGLVRVYRTPGGQRRYAPEDLEGFLASMRQPAVAQAVPRYGRNADIGSSADSASLVAAGEQSPAVARATAAREPARRDAERPEPVREQQRRRAPRAA
jgi:excisionase family DNA binding protein